MRTVFQELLDEHRDITGRKHMLEEKMINEVMTFKGTLQEAVKEGMVRFNFPTPAYMRRRPVSK